MSALNAQVETFTRLTALGETVMEALDYTQVISASGATEIERTVAAIGTRELPAPVTGALDALTAAGERVITEGQLKLQPNARVRIDDAGGLKAPAALPRQ